MTLLPGYFPPLLASSDHGWLSIPQSIPGALASFAGIAAVLWLTSLIPANRPIRQWFMAVLLASCTIGCSVLGLYSIGLAIPIEIHYAPVFTGIAVCVLPAFVFLRQLSRPLVNSATVAVASIAGCALFAAAHGVLLYVAEPLTKISYSLSSLFQALLVGGACTAAGIWFGYSTTMRPSRNEQIFGILFLSAGFTAFHLLTLTGLHTESLASAIPSTANEVKSLLVLLALLCAGLMLSTSLLRLRGYIEAGNQPEEQLPRWHLIYYVMAISALLGVSGSLLVNHQIIRRYNDVLLVSQQWHNQYHDVLAITQTIGAYNEVPPQPDSLAEALAQSKEAFHALQHSYPHFNLNQNAGFLGLMGNIDHEIAQIEAHKATITAPELLARQQAILMLTNLLMEQLHDEEQQLFGQQTDSLRLIGSVEYGVGGMALLVILLATLYGKNLSIRVLKNELMRREAEETHRQAVAMAEKANQAKTDFLATMSHEIRTPMNGVIGMADLLGKTTLDERQKNYLDIIQKSGETLMEIINDILDFSKIEAGELHLEHIPFSLRHLAEDIGLLLIHRAEKAGIDLLVRIDPAMPPMLAGDPTRIRQIMMNLVGNAIKFTKKGHVKLQVICEADTGSDIRIRIEVEDTGIGIPLAKQEIIFDRFTQADSSSTRHFGGTGLGLAITKKLAQMMGGDVGVISAEGKGSTFWCRLSLPVLCIADRSQHTDPTLLKGLRMIIVDQLPFQADTIRELTEHYMARCDSVETEAELLPAMRKAAQEGEPYHLVVYYHHEPNVLLMLPATIRSEASLGNPALIAMQSASMVGDAATLKAAGYHGYLSRPVRLQQLLDVIALSWRAHGTKDAPLATKHLGEEIRKDRASTSDAPLVLVVEDNEVNRIVTGNMLRTLGYRYELASSGQAGIEAIKKYDAIALILTDIHMPDMTGLEMTAAIRQMSGLSQPPIVALTADVTKDTLQKVRDSQMNDLLHKPVKLEALRQMLAKWIQPPEAPEQG